MEIAIDLVVDTSALTAILLAESEAADLLAALAAATRSCLRLTALNYC